MWGCIYIWFGYKPLPPHDLNVQVIYALTAHLKKTHTDAVALATFVDRKVSLVTIVCWCMILLVCLYKCNISVYLFCSPVALYVDAFCKCVVLVVLTLPLPSPPLPLKGRAVCAVGTQDTCQQDKERINVRNECVPIPLHAPSLVWAQFGIISCGRHTYLALV